MHEFVWHDKYLRNCISYKQTILKLCYLFKKMDAARWRESHYRCCYRNICLFEYCVSLLVWIMEVLYNFSINVPLLCLCLVALFVVGRSSCFLIHLLSILTFNRIIVCTQSSCTSLRYRRLRSLISVVTSWYVPFALPSHARSFLLHNANQNYTDREFWILIHVVRNRMFAEVPFRRENFKSIYAEWYFTVRLNFIS